MKSYGTDRAAEIDLAKMASDAGFALMALRHGHQSDESVADLTRGVVLCEILEKGYELKGKGKPVKLEDMPAWQAFEEVLARPDAINLQEEEFRLQLKKTKGILTSAVRPSGRASREGELLACQEFFLRLIAVLT